MFTPFFDGIYTQYRSLKDLRSVDTAFSLAEGCNWFCFSFRDPPKFNEQKGLLPNSSLDYRRIASLLFGAQFSTNFCFMYAGTDSSSDELEPNSFCLFLTISNLQAFLSALYFSLSTLKLSTCGLGELCCDELVLVSSARWAYLVAGGGCRRGSSSELELEEWAHSLRSCTCAQCLRALR